MRRRFFVGQFTDGKATLSGPSAHHLGRVLRAESGQLYELTDGQRLCLARVERIGHGCIDFAVVESLPTPVPRLDPTLLIAVVRFERFEWALEKATELGVSAIVPLAAERSEKALLMAAPKRAERWRRILLEAAQQARCLRLPTLRPLASPQQAFPADDSPVRILLSEQAGAAHLRDVLEEKARNRVTLPPSPLRLSLAFGPEGGWTEREIAAAGAAQFRAASLGDQILRTETAVVAGLGAVQLYLG